MQNLHSIPGGSPGRFFPTGGGVSGTAASTAPCPTSFIDRRLRPHPQQNLKCPRCDSPNTKFCYYNNYNLSQPRHFCKSCRRYWTKGGVLRNVPVGGGCRKSSSKRSSASSSTTSSSSKTSKYNSSSSPSPSSSRSSSGSDSSTLTTITTPPDAPLATPEIFPPPTTTGLTSTMGYNFSNLYAFQIPPPQQHQTQIKVDVDDHVLAAMEGIKVPPEDLGFMDQAVPSPMDLPPLLDGRTGELAAIDWQGCLDSTLGFFDPAVGAAGEGDQSFFWSQSQWGVDTPYLP